MALMLGKLYDALRAAGVPEEKAREAAEEVATFEKDLAEIKSDVRLLKWITGTTLAGVIALVVRNFTGWSIETTPRTAVRALPDRAALRRESTRDGRRVSGAFSAAGREFPEARGGHAMHADARCATSAQASERHGLFGTGCALSGSKRSFEVRFWAMASEATVAARRKIAANFQATPEWGRSPARVAQPTGERCYGMPEGDHCKECCLHVRMCSGERRGEEEA
jgi:hypothetical protein